MPYAKRKNKDGTYRVINSETSKVHAKSTSSTKANTQVRLHHMKGNEGKKKLDWDTSRSEADKILRERE